MEISQKQIDQAIANLDAIASTLDQLLSAGQIEDNAIDLDRLTRATSILTAVAYSALSMNRVWIVLFNDRRTGDSEVDRVFRSHEAALRYAIPGIAERLSRDAPDLAGLNLDRLVALYEQLKSDLEQADNDAPFGGETIWIVEKTLEDGDA